MTKQQLKTGVGSLLVGVLAPMALIVPSVNAATINWNGGTDASLTTPANWDGGSIPGAADSAVFPVSSNTQNLSLSGAWSVDQIIFNGEVTGSSSKSYFIEGDDTITIGSSIEAIMAGSGGDHIVASNVTLGGDVELVTSGSNTLQIGNGFTVSGGSKGGGGSENVINLGSNDLTLRPDGGTISLVGVIDGSGNIIINGDGKINMLTKGATGYSGATTITNGTFEAVGETEGNVVINGGTLKGTSSLLGTVTMSSGSIEPGLSPGCLGTGDLTLTGGTYVVEINGNTVCTEYDQTTVVGTVDLGSASTLDVQRLSSFDPAVNDTFAIILNDGTDAVQGTFLDLANGSEFTVEGYTYQINYDAGDGNDVLLLVKATPSAPDTGIGSVLTSPLAAVAATFAALSVLGGLKFAEQRRK